ncbi:MAG TPA: hypothetical protein VH796_04380 [Nitrososphaeraceae archaeon]|jgi:hypothetical protein
MAQKTSGVTFRLDENLLSRLRRESTQKQVSLNTLASQVFQSHADYEIYASKAGMVSFPKTLLMRIMDKLNDDEVGRLSEYIAENEIKDFVLLMNQEYSVRAFLRTIDSWLRATGFVYRHEVSSENPNIHVFVINHSMGKRWSLYFEKLFKYCLNDLGHTSVGFDVTDSSIVFKVDILDQR